MFRFTTIKDYHNNLQSGQTTVVEAVRFFGGAAKKLDEPITAGQSLLRLHE